MKKFLIAIFAVCLTLFVASCKQSDNNSIKNGSTPIIDAEFEVSYGVVNTEIDLPQYAAYLDGEGITATSVMRDDAGKTVDLTNGFIPTQTGEYIYTISAKHDEVEASKNVYFYIEENSDYFKNKIASFDKPYGVNHFRQATGIVMSYSKDYKYDNQVGTTKVSVDSRKGGELYFSLGNFHIKDLTNSKGIIFYVYNNNPGHIKLYFNWTNATTLMPHTWNRVYLDESGLQKLEASYNPLLEENFSLSSIDGLEIELGQTASADSVYDLYFSALYNLDAELVVDVDAVKAVMDEFIFSYEKTQAKINEIETMYNSLSDDDKQLVDNYNSFRNAVIDFYKKNIVLVKDKALYFDNEIGVRQVSNVKGANLENTTLYKYDNEQSSTLIDIYDFDAKITIGYPFIENISGYDYLTMHFYNPNLSDYVLFNRIGGNDVVLKAQEWTKVDFDLSDISTLNDAVIWIYSGDWHVGLEYGVKIYMSAAYLTYNDNLSYSPLELKEAIDNITDELSVDALKRLENNYNKFSEQEKALVDNFDDLLNAIYQRIMKDEAMSENDALLSFDKPVGLEQITIKNATGEYTTDVKLNGESGSTKFNVSGFDLLLTLAYVPNTDKLCQTIEFSVYNDNDYDIVFFPEFFVGVKKEVVFSANQWTTIIIEVNSNVNCRGTILWFYSGDWNRGIEGATLYISKVKISYTEMGDSLLSFTETDFSEKLSANGYEVAGSAPEGNAILSYNDEIAFNNVYGGVEIISQSFYSDIKFNTDCDISKYEQIRFVIYNNNNVKQAFVDQGKLSGQQTVITLAPKSWTVITLDRADNITTLKDYVFRVYDGGGWGSIANNSFYLSNIYGAGKVDALIVMQAIDDFIFSFNRTKEDIDNIEAMYARLSNEDKGNVVNYTDFRNAVIEYYKNIVDIEADKVIYFDTPIGMEQISNAIGANVSYSTAYQYENETGSTEIDIYGFDGRITIGYPFIADIAGYDFMRIYFYNPQTIEYVLFNRIGGSDVVLAAQQWTAVDFDLSSVSSLNDAVIWIYSGDWNHGLEYGVKIYMSAAYLHHDGVFYSPEELVEIIDGISDEESLEELKLLRNIYESYSTAQKKKVGNYNKLLDSIYYAIKRENALLNQTENLIYFDSAAGLEQITIEKANGTYTTSVKFGDEAGSTKFDVSGFDLLIHLDYVTSESNFYESVEFSVYNDNNYDVVFFPNFFVGDKQEVVLTANAWTTVNVAINGNASFRDTILWFYSGNWNNGIDGATLYISAVKLNVAEMGEKVVDFTSSNFINKLSSNGVKNEGQTPEGYAELYYNNELGFNGDNATVKIITRSFYSDVVVHDNASIFGYSQIRFAIYNANNVNRMFVDQSRLNGVQTRIWLPANSWTIITLDLSGTRVSIDGFTFRIYDGAGWGNISGDVFYLTDIYALGETVEDAHTVLDLTAENYASKLNADLHGGSEGHGTLEFDTTYSIAGHNGSVKLTSYSFYTDIKISDSTALIGYESLRIFVYNANSATHTCRFNGTNVVLAANTWTAVTIDAASLVSLDGIIIRIYKDSGYGNISGNVFYLSDIEGIKGSQATTTTLIDFSEAIPINTSNATLSYDTEYRVGAENGSLKVETKTDSQFYVDLTFNTDIDISEYSSIQFIVYSAYNGLETSGETNTATRYLQTYNTLDANPAQYALSKESWTVITVELGENITSLMNVKIRLFPGGYGKFNGEIFYIANVVGIR